MFQSIHQTNQSSDNAEDEIKAKKKSILDPNEMMHGLNRSMQMGGPQDPADSGGSNIAQAMFNEEDEKPGQMKAIQKAGVEEEEPLQGKAIQKSGSEEEEVQMKESSADSTQSASSGSSTQSSLPKDVNAKMEASFGANFSNVNIHTNDSKATQMKALAFTQGNNVHFAPGQYNPNTSKGQELIGHEYTHVVQQGAGRVAPTRQAKGMAINDNPALENEADVMGKKAAQGNEKAGSIDSLNVNVLGNSFGIQLKEDTDSNLVFEQIRDWVDEHWPVNYGAELGVEVGATFGFPIGGAVNLVNHFYRKDEDTIVLRKYSKLKAGLDSGISAGAYFGIKGSYGVGGEAGVDGEVMGALYTDLLYEFPMNDGEAVTSALYSILPQGGISTAMGLAVALLDKFGGYNLSPFKYLKSSEAALGMEAQGTASAQAGLRTSESGENYARRNDPNEFIPDDAAGKPDHILLRMLNLQAVARLGASAFGGAKLEYVDRDPETFNIKMARATVFMKNNLEGNLSTPLPFMNAQGSIGTAQKINFNYIAGQGWAMDDISLSVSTGELDFYEGSGMEFEVGIPTKAPEQWDRREFQDYFSTIKFTKRLAIEGIFGRRYKGFKNTFNGLDRMVKNTKKANKITAGLNVGSYLTLGFDLAKADFSPLMELLDSLDGRVILNEFNYFLENGEFSSQLIVKARAILNIFLDSIEKAELYLEIGGGIAGGIKLAVAEAKGRLAFVADGAITYTEDFTEYIKDDFNLDDLKNLMKGIVPAGN